MIWISSTCVCLILRRSWRWFYESARKARCMVSRRIRTEKAPVPTGPYSQAVVANDHVYVSGQGPRDPKTGELVMDDIANETEQVINNLSAILNSAGCSLEDVIRSTVYLADMDDYHEFNRVYGRFFEPNPPSRTCVEVSRLPSDINVEIDAVALIE